MKHSLLHRQVARQLDGVDHHLQRRVDDGSGFLRVESLDQLHRAFDVGEEDGDRLWFAVEILRGDAPVRRIWVRSDFFAEAAAVGAPSAVPQSSENFAEEELSAPHFAQ